MTIDEATRVWLTDLFATIDAKDTGRFVDVLTEDASFRFGSAAPVLGRDNIRAAVDGFFSTIAASRHTLSRSMMEDGALICEGEVTYTRHDDAEITLPFANFLELDGKLISNYKIYADAGPLYAP